MEPSQSQSQQSALETFGQDYTQLARDGKLDPVIGRDEEIRRCMQVLSRRTKNNPMLIGEPGVGKTAIVEGLAQRIIRGDVPASLKDKRLISVEVGSLLAGASFRGQFEQRLKDIFKEVEDSDGEIILFIDEAHTIVGAGKSEGTVDAGNMLKPLLARGKLRLIGATTLNEYRENIEKDAALERRFQPVYVGEPSLDDTIAILRGIQEKYEVHHGVRITDQAIVAAARLSDRYISDRFLPDKAVDLLDEATSGLKMQLDSRPIELDKLERRKVQLEIELSALKKDKSAQAKDRKKAIEQEVEDITAQAKELEARWQQEKKIIDAINDASEKLEKLKQDLERFEREGELNEAAKVKYGEIPEYEKTLAESAQKLAHIPESERMLQQEVTQGDIADVVSRWTGVPTDKLLESESQKLSHLEDHLHQRVVGQNQAVDSVANAIRRSRAGISDQNRPIGSFLFLGPTGVGKTELAKALAEQLFDSESAIVRIDMSEYMEQHAVARLIGSPPGYVGYEQGGQLTEAVRRRPYSIVLFDEIEKAHPDVFNVLLQVLDDGRLTDGKGRSVNFANTIIIMTSNVGSDVILEWDGKDMQALQNTIKDKLRHQFRPEFLNRIDDTVIFERISQQGMATIVDKELAKLAQNLKANKDVDITFTKELKDMLSKQGYDPLFGARPLRRLIQKQILDELAKKFIDSSSQPKSSYTVNYKNNKVVIS